MKILITGASGLLGREIKLAFEQVKSWKVVGTGFSRLNDDLEKLDLRCPDDIINFLNRVQPDIVIHSAAERNYGAIVKNESEAFSLNVKATETIARTVNGYGGYVLYISTNLVFDGSNPPYKATDKPTPANTYGQLKLEGENVLLRNCPKAGILRVPLLFGKVEHVNESGVSHLLSILKDTSKKTVVSNYELKYPTSTSDVAIVCKQIIECYHKKNEFDGIFHWCSNDRLTKYKMIEMMSQLFQLPMSHIEPSAKHVGRHSPPYDCALDTSKLEKIGIGQRTSFENVLKECLQSYVD